MRKLRKAKRRGGPVLGPQAQKALRRAASLRALSESWKQKEKGMAPTQAQQKERGGLRPEQVQQQPNPRRTAEELRLAIEQPLKKKPKK